MLHGQMSSVIVNESVSQDLNGSNNNEPEIAEEVVRMAMMINPCNTNEILMFGADESHDISVYNRITNKSKKNKIGLQHTNGYGCVACYVVGGNTADTLIVLWGNLNWNDISPGESYYGIFNCKRMEFDHAIKNDWGIFASETIHKIMINNLNLLFRITADTIVAYDVSNENSPKTIATNANIPETYLYYHASIMLIQKDIVKFVIFGSANETFDESFYQTKLDLKTLSFDDELCLNDNDNDDECDINITRDNAKEIDLNRTLNEISYNWYNSRYLIIVGGCDYHYASDRIICFDFKRKIWYSYKLPSTIHSQKSILIHEKNDIYLYVFGGKESESVAPQRVDGSPKLRWKLRMTKQLDWNIERLIWIGYYKNKKGDKECHPIAQENPKHCIFGGIPKDVVAFILSFIRRQFLYV